MAYLKDIANEAGVSIRTVTRVLKENGPVAHDTRERVLSVAKRLRYRPHRLARSLRTRQSYLISFILWRTDDIDFRRAAIFENVAREQDYLTVVHCASPALHQIDRPFRILEQALDLDPAGVVLHGSGRVNTPALVEKLRESGVPHVVFDTLEDGPDTIRVDRIAGVRESVLYLGRQGYRNIAYIGRLIGFFEMHRLKGYHEALQILGLPHRYLKIPLEADGFQQLFEAGRRIGRTFPEMEDRPDAVQAFSDCVALGFLAGLHDRGLSAPKDVAIVGFDNRREAAFASPPLTTITHPNEDIGALAADLLVRKIRNEAPPAGGWSQVLPARLVVRETA